MKILLLICLFTSIHAIEISKCEQSAIQAKSDLNKGKVNFMIQGGIVSIYKEGQEFFEQKYKVKYFDLGCIAPANLCIEHYNAEVAKYLDLKYGKKWRKEVRADFSLPIL